MESAPTQRGGHNTCAQTPGVHGGGHQTVPLARLREENLGVGAEETGRATYKQKTLEVVGQEQGWDCRRPGSGNRAKSGGVSLLFPLSQTPAWDPAQGQWPLCPLSCSPAHSCPNRCVRFAPGP